MNDEYNRLRFWGENKKPLAAWISDNECRIAI
jgi:hypothetical protein